MYKRKHEFRQLGCKFNPFHMTPYLVAPFQVGNIQSLICTKVHQLLNQQSYQGHSDDEILLQMGNHIMTLDNHRPRALFSQLAFIFVYSSDSPLFQKKKLTIILNLNFKRGLSADCKFCSTQGASDCTTLTVENQESKMWFKTEANHNKGFKKSCKVWHILPELYFTAGRVFVSTVPQLKQSLQVNTIKQQETIKILTVSVCIQNANGIHEQPASNFAAFSFYYQTPFSNFMKSQSIFLAFTSFFLAI